MADWRLTRRGWWAFGLLLAALLILSLLWAFDTGQQSQCQWFKQHGTAAQVRQYCS